MSIDMVRSSFSGFDQIVHIFVVQLPAIVKNHLLISKAIFHSPVWAFTISDKKNVKNSMQTKKIKLKCFFMAKVSCVNVFVYYIDKCFFCKFITIIIYFFWFLSFYFFVNVETLSLTVFFVLLLITKKYQLSCFVIVLYWGLIFFDVLSISVTVFLAWFVDILLKTFE